MTLPANIAAQIRSLAKNRRLSANRMIVELTRSALNEQLENGIEADKRKQKEFFELAERFRTTSDPEQVKRLGDQMGRMIFGDGCLRLEMQGDLRRVARRFSFRL
jgi:hypothetical protein